MARPCSSTCRPVWAFSAAVVETRNSFQMHIREQLALGRCVSTVRERKEWKSRRRGGAGGRLWNRAGVSDAGLVPVCVPMSVRVRVCVWILHAEEGLGMAGDLWMPSDLKRIKASPPPSPYKRIFNKPLKGLWLEVRSSGCALASGLEPASQSPRCLPRVLTDERSSGAG